MALTRCISPKHTRIPRGFSRLYPFFVSVPPRGSSTISTPSGLILKKTTSLLSTWWLAQRETASFVSPIPLMLRMRKNKINSLFHAGQVTKCFVHSSQLKTVKKCEEIVSWHQLAHKFAVVSRSKTWSHVSRRFKLGYCFLHH